MSEDTVPRSEMEKLFHIRDDYQGPDLPLNVPVYDPDGPDNTGWKNEIADWFMWRVRENELERVPAMPAGNLYFAKEAESPRDVFSEFFHFHTQHVRYPGVATQVGYLLADLRHLATAMAKIGLFDYLYQSTPFNPDRFVRSEIEFIITTCRSMYESWYNVLQHTWNNIKLPEKQDLPAKEKMLFTKGDDPVTKKYLKNNRKFPDALAKCIAESAQDFLDIRAARDAIIHQGDTVNPIFRGSDGLGVHENDEILQYFSQAWNPTDIGDTGVAPLWPPVAYAIRAVTRFLNRYAKAIQKDVRFPEAIAPGYITFIRGECVHYLCDLTYMTDVDPYGVYVREDVRLRFIEEGGLPAEVPDENS